MSGSASELQRNRFRSVTLHEGSIDESSMKNTIRSARARFSTSVELLAALWKGPYWWLVPLVIVLLMMSILFVFLQAAPLVAPFVYTVF